MFNEDKLRDMVIDLKLGESSESFEEMLEKVSQDNRLYGELVKTSKKETIDKTMLFYEFRAWFTRNMELDILSYLKGVI
ncbi:MAG: hypothetical protein MSA56_06225 [Clostridium sp.]|nr:hypothetical protein [Clostridium sp.]